MSRNLAENVHRKRARSPVPAEGCSIRATERLTDIHRDTIMRLGVRVGTGCATLHDEMMKFVQVNRLELDELLKRGDLDGKSALPRLKCSRKLALPRLKCSRKLRCCLI
jgi:hypothetical protein